MTNFEKYKDELCKILSYYVAVSDDKPCVCKDLSCKNCDFDDYALDCIQEAEDWLKKEVTKRRMVDVPDINVGNSSEIPNNSDCVSRRAAVEEIANQSRFSAEEIINICDKSVQDENGWLGGLKEAILAVLELPSVQPEKEIPKRVRWSGWKGTRYTRYYCPNCEKPVRNDDYYCHRCGQKLMFPKVTFTDYVPGEKQQTIVTWEDEK